MLEVSITVDEGDTVQEGKPVSAVGNSGNTPKRHLHMHAVNSGVGVPIKFNGEFLTRNDLVRSN